jgi:hypothetical protein
MPELTITSPYVPSERVDSNTFNIGNPTSELNLTLCQSRLYFPVRDFGFGLWNVIIYHFCYTFVFFSWGAGGWAVPVDLKNM